MSLDIYLEGEVKQVPCNCCHCGKDHTRDKKEEFFSSNITHNLNRMAGEAGIYDIIWRPEENGITKAEQLIEPLKKGIELMRSDPERFKKFNPSNGWGTYDDFIPWLEEYLIACESYPDATVKVSR